VTEIASVDDIREILKYLPHRYPFLLVDRVTAFEPMKSLTAIKPSEKTLYLLVGIDKARFKRQVIPGDQLVLDVTLQKERRGIWVFHSLASVDGQTACTAEVLIARNEIDE